MSYMSPVTEHMRKTAQFKSHMDLDSNLFSVTLGEKKSPCSKTVSSSITLDNAQSLYSSSQRKK